MTVDNLDRLTWSLEGRQLTGEILGVVNTLIGTRDLDPDLRRFLNDGDSNLRVYRRDPDAWKLGIVLVRDQANFAGLLFNHNLQVFHFMGETEGRAFRSSSRTDLEWTISVAKRRPVEETCNILAFDDKRPYDSFAQIAKSFLFEREVKRSSPAMLHAPDTMAIFDPRPVMDKLPMPPLDLGSKGQLLLDGNVMRYLGAFSGSKVRQFIDNVLSLPRPEGHNIFITLDLEKRIWIEQEEGLVRFINAAADLNPCITAIYFNGMTAPFGGAGDDLFPDVKDVELQLIESMRKRVPERLRIVSLFGQTLSEKLECARDCGFFMAPCGSGSLVPQIMRLPGVLYQNTAHIRWNWDLDHPEAIRIPPDKIQDRPEVKSVRKRGRPSHNISYSIDPEEFAGFAMDWYMQVRSDK